MAFCSGCGSQMADGAAFCPKCGRAAGAGPSGGAATAPAQAYAAPSAGLSDNAAGALAYVTFIPALIFLLIEPYNRRPFVRFHAFQSLFFCIAWIAVSAALSFVVFRGFGLGFGLFMLVRLAFFVAWVVLLIKASQGQMWELPVIGPLAKQQAQS
jgi:uncharacterized membrane protein